STISAAQALDIALNIVFSSESVQRSLRSKRLDGQSVPVNCWKVARQAARTGALGCPANSSPGSVDTDVAANSHLASFVLIERDGRPRRKLCVTGCERAGFSG